MKYVDIQHLRSHIPPIGSLCTSITYVKKRQKVLKKSVTFSFMVSTTNKIIKSFDRVFQEALETIKLKWRSRLIRNYSVSNTIIFALTINRYNGHCEKLLEDFHAEWLLKLQETQSIADLSGLFQRWITRRGTTLSFSARSVENREMAQFKSEYLKCVPQFDGNPNELNRYLSTCESLISHFYGPTNPNNNENIYLLNSLVSKLTGNARLVTNIQSVNTWEELKDTLTRNIADQRDEACLNRDLVLLRQYQNEKPQQFFDTSRCLQILNLLCSYVDAHEATADAKVLKRNIYNNLALNTFLVGVRESLGTTLRCMRSTSMTQAFTNKPYNKYASAQNKPPAPSQKQNNNFQNSHPTQQFGFQNQNNFRRPQNNFVGPQTNFGRFQNTFSNQPSQFQNRVNNQSQGFSRNSQMFRPPQQNVFKPNQNNQNFPKATPMSVSTRQTSSNNVRQPMRPPYQYQPQQRNFTFEELHNAR
ncbi:hypothetical protein NQ317_019129 [Molorchus minor]|uniref:Uncharacterized protein n=1 Tax=Molorchus minor TaxID=1323400 RepID=A0ABQ9JH94_9CUCU|nr:hypothetical protein NQ317_019129 [Molorchus minor]